MSDRRIQGGYSRGESPANLHGVRECQCSRGAVARRAGPLVISQAALLGVLVVLLAGCALFNPPPQQTSITIAGSAELPETVAAGKVEILSALGTADVGDDGGFSVECPDTPTQLLCVSRDGAPLLLGFAFRESESGGGSVQGIGLWRLAPSEATLAVDVLAINARTTAVAVVVLSPLFLGADAATQARVASLVTEDPDFVDLADAVAALLTGGEDLLSDSASGIYTTAARIAEKVHATVVSDEQPEAATLGTALPMGLSHPSDVPWVEDGPQNHVRFVNPREVWYAVGAHEDDTGILRDAFLLKNREFKWLQLPPGLTPNTETPYPFYQGNRWRFVVTRGINPFFDSYTYVVSEWLSNSVSRLATAANLCELTLHLVDLVVPVRIVVTVDSCLSFLDTLGATNVGELLTGMVTEMAKVSVNTSPEKVLKALLEFLAKWLTDPKNKNVEKFLDWMLKETGKVVASKEFTTTVFSVISKLISFATKIDKVLFLLDLRGAPRGEEYRLERANQLTYIPTVKISVVSSTPGGEVPLTLALRGSGSDRDGVVVQHRWTFEYEPNAPCDVAVAPDVSGQSAVSHTYSNPGQHVVAVEVLDNDGSWARDTLTFTANPGGSPDLRFESVWMKEASFAPGADVHACFRAVNKGNAATTGFQIGFYLDGNQLQTYDCAGLKKDEVISETMPAFKWPDSNCHVLRAVLDTANVVAEGDETNNTSEKTICPTTTDDVPDLIAEDPRIDPADFVAGQTVRVYYSVRNSATGGDVKKPFYYKVEVDGKGGASTYTTMLARGDTAESATAPFVWPTDGQCHVLRVTVDTTNTIVETDENNNIREKSYCPPNVPPSANFTFSPSSPTTADTVSFTDTSTDPDGPIVAWAWDFGDGGTSPAKNPTHKYGTAKSYMVTLTVTDDDGAKNTATKNVVVGVVPPPNVPPSASFTVSPSSPTTADTVSFTDTSTDPDGPIVAWAWDFGDGGTSPAKNPTHKYGTAKSYMVTLTVTDDDGANTTVTKAVSVSLPSDTTPPTVSIQCWKPDECGTVCASWSATDNSSSASEIQYQYQNPLDSPWSGWGSLTTQCRDGLPNGVYSICVRARDKKGNVSPLACCQVVVALPSQEVHFYGDALRRETLLYDCVYPYGGGMVEWWVVHPTLTVSGPDMTQFSEVRVRITPGMGANCSEYPEDCLGSADETIQPGDKVEVLGRFYSCSEEVTICPSSSYYIRKAGRRYQVSVDARVCAWQNFGIAVAAGDTLTFAASGQVVHWKSAGGAQKAYCGPEGSGPGACDNPAESCCLTPGLPNNALVGKIGSSAPFYIGPSQSTVAAASGSLYLGMNETANCGGCADNEGSWTVTVIVVQP